MTESLAGKTIVMSGGSRGIGLAIAVRAAADGANVVLLSKTDDPNPKLEGTIHTAADAIREAGGQALAVVGDVRSDESIAHAVQAAVDQFGGIDICVNNASVLALTGTLTTDIKRYDLMQDVNTRGTFMLTRACLPHLLKAPNPHVLSLSPPINLASQQWLGAFPPYLLAKYGMTLATIAIAAEFAEQGLAANTLWPRTTIATSAVKNLLGGEKAVAASRSARIMADAAYAIVSKPAAYRSGKTLIDDQVLAEEGVTDLSGYAEVPGSTDFRPDLFLD